MERPSQISFLNKDIKGLCKYVDASEELTATFNKIATEENPPIKLPQKGKCTLSFAKNILATDKLPDDVLTAIAVDFGWVEGAEPSSSEDSPVAINGLDTSIFETEAGDKVPVVMGTYWQQSGAGRFKFKSGTCVIVVGKDSVRRLKLLGGLHKNFTQVAFKPESIVAMATDSGKYKANDTNTYVVGDVNFTASPELFKAYQYYLDKLDEIEDRRLELRDKVYRVKAGLTGEEASKAYAERDAKIDAKIQEEYASREQSDVKSVKKPDFAQPPSA